MIHAFLSVSANRSVLKQKRRAAFSLTEIAIVLGVIGLMLGGIWGFITTGWEKDRQQTALQEVLLVGNNVRGFFSGQAGVTGNTDQIITSNLLTVGSIPNNMQRSGTCTTSPCADNPWGSNAFDPAGTFRICNWNIGVNPPACLTAAGATSQFFGIELTGLTQTSCIALLELISAPNGPPGLVEVSINGNLLAYNSKPVQPVAVSDAKGNCANSGNGNAIIFVYRLIVSS